MRIRSCINVRLAATSLALQPTLVLGGDPAAGSPTATLLRLLPPCLAKVRHDQQGRASPKLNSDGATGGVCKEQGRIHRAMMTRGY